MLRFLGTVQEFVDSQWLKGTIPCVEKGTFWAMLEKAIIGDGVMREATADEQQRGYWNAIMVKQVHNVERPNNHDSLDPPPPRTGKLDAFMNEVEATAVRAGLQYVWVDKVYNEFLPSKLKKRGYQRIDVIPSRPHFVKPVSTEAIPANLCGFR